LGETVRRITKAALGGLAGCALLVGVTQAANGDSPILEYKSWGNLVPLQQPSAFSNASVSLLRIRQAPEATNFKLTVRDINTSMANPVHGAHLHVGACTGDPSATGGHFQHEPAIGATPENEVWFDLVPNDDGIATDSTTVPFIPTDNDGVMSIVIHAAPAATPGALSPKLACFTLLVDKAPLWN
jgi:Cu/Zn superoxide dismutase